MSESEIGERVKYSVSIEMEVPSYESTRYLPDSLVVRFDKKKAQTNEVTQPSEQLFGTGNDMLDDKIKPAGKLRLFIEIFNALASEDRYEIKKEILIQELVNTGKFTEQEALVYIKLAQQYGFHI